MKTSRKWRIILPLSNPTAWLPGHLWAPKAIARGGDSREPGKSLKRKYPETLDTLRSGRISPRARVLTQGGREKSLNVRDESLPDVKCGWVQKKNKGLLLLKIGKKGGSKKDDLVSGSLEK